MTIVCAICQEEMSSIHLDEKLAIPDILNSMTTHLRLKHKEEHQELTEDCLELQKIIITIPAFLLVDRFIDVESEKTSPGFKEASNKIDEGIASLGEIVFGNIEEGGEEEKVEDAQTIST